MNAPSHPRLPHPTRSLPKSTRCFHHLTPRVRKQRSHAAPGPGRHHHHWRCDGGKQLSYHHRFHQRWQGGGGGERFGHQFLTWLQRAAGDPLPRPPVHAASRDRRRAVSHMVSTRPARWCSLVGSTDFGESQAASLTLADQFDQFRKGQVGSLTLANRLSQLRKGKPHRLAGLGSFSAERETLPGCRHSPGARTPMVSSRLA